jgi:hypothetical protein
MRVTVHSGRQILGRISKPSDPCHKGTGHTGLDEEHPGVGYSGEKGGRTLKYRETAQAGHMNRRALGKKNQRKYQGMECGATVAEGWPVAFVKRLKVRALVG